MEQIITWVQNNWWLVLLIIGVIAKVINVLTKHFSEYKGFVRILMVIVDILDVIKVTPRPRSNRVQPKITLSLLAVLICLAMTGCACKSFTSNVRSWSTIQLKHYKKLVDDKYESADTRLNAYKAMASLVCSTDLQEGKAVKDSVACQCQRSGELPICDRFFSCLEGR